MWFRKDNENLIKWSNSSIIITALAFILIIIAGFSYFGLRKDKIDYEEEVKELINIINDSIETIGYKKPVTFVFYEDEVYPTLKLNNKSYTGSITTLEDNKYIINQISNGKFCISTTDLTNMEVKDEEECKDLSYLIPVLTDSGVNK